MLNTLKRKFAKIALVVLALQLAFMGVGVGATGTYASVADTTAPVGGTLTLMTINHPAPGIVTTPVGDAYTITPALMGTDQFTSLNLIVVDDNINTTPVPVFVDGVANGTMVYVGPSWGYVPGTPVDFTEGTHTLAATFVDNYENSTRLTASFVTDETAPALASVTAVLGGVTQNKLAIEDLIAVVGQSVGAITATLTEDATQVSGTTGDITISGGTTPIPAGTPYGTFTVLGSDVTITPNAGNDVLGQDGTFTFTVAAGTLRDVAGNLNDEATFSLVVTPPIAITAIGAIIGTSQVGEVLTAGALTPSLATASYQWQISATEAGTYTDIPGATSSTYTLVAGDIDKYIKVVATGTEGYTGTVTSPATTIIKAIPAPAGVENLKAVVNSDGTVTLSWNQPLTGPFTGFRVLRDGVDISGVLGSDQRTFTDYNTVRGQTYNYSVVTIDANTGLTNTLSAVPVSIPAAVVATAFTDNSNTWAADYVTPETNPVAEDVKAADVAPDTTPATTDDNSFPTWGIIILLILAAVGGYLIWSQGPQETAPVVGKKKTGTTIKKK